MPTDNLVARLRENAERWGHASIHPLGGVVVDTAQVRRTIELLRAAADRLAALSVPAAEPAPAASERARSAGGGGAMSEYHWRNGVYFNRLPDGSVTIRIDMPSGDKFFDVGTIPAAEWASIVHAIGWEDYPERSAQGEVRDDG